MKSLGLLLIAVGLVLPLVPAQAQTGSTSFELETHAVGGEFFFTLKGASEHNPTLTVPANTDITVKITNTGDTPHNFCFNGDTKCTDYVNALADTQSLTFNSGATGGEYHCLPHKSSGMKGTVAIAGAATSTPTKASPGFEIIGLSVAALGAALVLRRK